MKRIITICAAAALVLQSAIMLSACGSDEKKEEKGTVSVSQSADTTAAAQTDSTAATDATDSSKATDSTQATTVPTTQKPTQAKTKTQSRARRLLG